MRLPALLTAAIAAILRLFAQVGCATQAETGTLLGGAGGAAIGGALTGSGWGALAGSVLGGLAGGAVGRELDARDRQRFGYALAEVPTHQPYAWTNPDTGAYWQVTPQETYRAPQGYPCREFSVLARVRGQIEETYGTACLQPDGTWQMVG